MGAREDAHRGPPGPAAPAQCSICGTFSDLLFAQASGTGLGYRPRGCPDHSASVCTLGTRRWERSQRHSWVAAGPACAARRATAQTGQMHRSSAAECPCRVAPSLGSGLCFGWGGKTWGRKTWGDKTLGQRVQFAVSRRGAGRYQGYGFATCRRGTTRTALRGISWRMWLS